MRKHKIVETAWPRIASPETPPAPGAGEHEARVEAARAAMERRGLSHLVVYGDREHWANLQYLTGFDPRFEEAVLVLRAGGHPLLVVGNECEGYLGVSPLFAAGRLRHRRYRSFSLISQPRDGSPRIRAVFAGEGIGPGARVGCVGWKYFADTEEPDAAHVIEIPAFLVDALRDLAGRDAVVNATDAFMDPEHGLRARCSAAEIAYLEYTGCRASDAMTRMIRGLRDGMTDFDVARLIEYTGEPLCCHVTLVTGDNRNLGLSGPIGARVRRGDPWGANVGYWGSNVCRAGWVAESAAGLPSAARDYVAGFAGPYFEVMGEWLRRLRIGTTGGELHNIVQENLPFDRFGISLNAGHLIHMDEWLSSPVFPGSGIPIRSGMAMQVDVIPSSPVYFSTRMEDGVAIADETLRSELSRRFPDAYARCQARRAFMTDVLGLDIGDEVLPLSNMPGIVPPFLLQPNRVLALS